MYKLCKALSLVHIFQVDKRSKSLSIVAEKVKYLLDPGTLVLHQVSYMAVYLRG